ncbi:ribulose-phosphate 3-epimerase [Candidatus Bathyarchaeota archaeon]|nr:ribulose-phosphate 3-epimerase [Candidatus Bathyarchaeota archaeon]
MRTIISPAIIANTQEELSGMLSSVKGYASRIMLDIMDGVFVPSKSLDFPFLLPTGFEYEAHLMVDDPTKYLRRLNSKIEVVSIHYESKGNIISSIQQFKEAGFRVLIALNPSTSFETIKQFLDSVEGILVMTVNPGFYGAPFLPECLDKIREIKQLKPSLEVEVDGGMNPINARAAKDAGATIIASGSYIMKSADKKAAIEELMKAVS